MRAELSIDKVGHRGQGVGTDADGNVYFVPGAVPGDVVLVEHEGGKRYRDATLVELRQPSPGRRDPACAHFNDCGGCDWLHWDYAEQLKAKDAMVTHVLARAGLEPKRREPIAAAAAPTGYRNRIQVRREGSRLGFYRRRSHEIVDIQSCTIAHPALNAELDRLRAEPVDPHRHKYELAVTDAGTVERLLDSPHAAAGFAQVNVGQNLVLRDAVTSAVRAGNARQVLELYAGNGNLTFAMLPLVEKILACDSSEEALKVARVHRDGLGPETARRAGFLTAMVDRALPRSLPPDFRDSYDTLVLDPPRSGIGPWLSSFLHPKLQNLIYVSCSPLAFANDVQCLKREFTFESVRAIDMFPHTRHVELVAHFSRSRSSS